MKNYKQVVKRALGNLAPYIQKRTTLPLAKASEILQSYSACPNGKCIANNFIDINYDLHIIIPVYNAENYLKSCIDSVLNQKTHYKYLVTIINDGSTDHSEQMLSRILEGKDYKLTADGGEYKVDVLSHRNKGYSGARNTGLKRIQGTYVMFLDSDDFIPEDSIENMLNMAFKTKADIVQGSWADFTNSGIRIEHRTHYDGLKNNTKAILSGFPWGKLYKYQVFKNFCFPEGFWYEDTPISFILYALPYRCAAINAIVYYYRLNPNGITATSSDYKKSVDSYWITELCLREFPEFGLVYDQNAYEFFLNQTILNWNRTRKRPLIVRKAIFVLTNQLISDYFPNFTTETLELRQLEKAIRNKRFVQYELLLRSM